MMKKVLIYLSVACVIGVTIGCRTLNLHKVEERTHNVEHYLNSRIDSMSNHSADSVFVYVEHNDSMLRIIEREVRTREKVKVVKDTVMVYLQSDTIGKVVTKQEKTTRSPPHRKLMLVLGLFTIVLVAVKLQTIKNKFKQ